MAGARGGPRVTRRLQEQYLVEQVEVIVDNGETVVIPPIFNDVFTAKVKRRRIGRGRAQGGQDAGRERARQGRERRIRPRPPA